MIKPIYGYGWSVLRKPTQEITPEYPELETLIEDMWTTMYKASGVGLAAPQIGLSIRLFIVDTVQMQEEGQEDQGIKQAFINPVILEEKGENWKYEEGCLSIPKISADVERLSTIEIEYYDENFNKHTAQFEGFNARVIQHEYDHLEGVLFIDKLPVLKRRLMNRKLEAIKKGKVNVPYKMKFSKK